MTLRDAIAPAGLRRDAAGDDWFDTPDTEFALAAGAACVSPRFDLATVHVAGADAPSFLQGQLITNLQRLEPGHGTLSAWCTPQGRVSFQFHLLPALDGYHLLVPASEAARLVQRLRMFVLRAQVRIEDVSADHGVLGLSAPQNLAGRASVLHAARHALTRIDEHLTALCIDDSARYLLAGPTHALAVWWRTSALPLIGTAVWRGLDIAQGHVEITGALANEFLPQQLNFDMREALAFDKGCYPGQEIIARLKYRGEVKSRLMCGRAAGAVPAGARLRTADARHAAGLVVSAVTLPSGETRFLAVVELGALPAVRLEDAPGVALRFERPPYWRA